MRCWCLIHCPSLGGHVGEVLVFDTLSPSSTHTHTLTYLQCPLVAMAINGEKLAGFADVAKHVVRGIP